MPQVETHLVAKQRPGACTGTVTLEIAKLADAIKQVQILFHALP